MDQSLKKVRLFRVQFNSDNKLPKSFHDGELVAFTEKEIASIKKNTSLAECFEPVQLDPDCIYKVPDTPPTGG